MVSNFKNVNLHREEGVYYCTTSSKDINICNSKSFHTIKVYGQRAESLRSSIITSFISKEYHGSGSRLFQIVFDDKCVLAHRVLDEVFYNLDKFSMSHNSLLLIQGSNSYKPCFDNCNSTNIVFANWDMNKSNDWNELIKYVSVMAGLYSYLSPPSLKAAMINAISLPLSHTVSNDGSFDYMKCLYSSNNHINMHIEDVVTVHSMQCYNLHISLHSRRVRITATVVTLFKPNDPATGEKYIDGIVTFHFPDMPDDNRCIKTDEIYGNIHRVRMELDSTELSRINNDLHICFKPSLLDGGNSNNLDVQKYYAVITVENLDDDGSGIIFYHEMLRLNYVSNLNIVRKYHYIV